MSNTASSQKYLAAFFILSFAAAIAPLAGQEQSVSIVLPWTGMEEAGFPLLPAGGWNVLGTFSPQAAARGETFFASSGPASGILNPAFLTGLTGPRLSLSYRYSALSYKTSSGIHIMTLDSRENEPRSTFSRKTGYPDGIGLALPLKKWTFAANYSLFLEYNTPDISASPFTIPSKVKQSGETRGISLAVSRTLGERFSMGISASYLYGRISRYEVSPVNFTWNFTKDDQSLGSNLRRLLANLLVVVPSWIEDSKIDLSGFLVNIGFSYRMKDNMMFGISLRTPFVMNLKSKGTLSWLGLKLPNERFSREINARQPLVATGSALFLPIPSFTITADISYWDWKNAEIQGEGNRGFANILQSLLKLNLGAEYRIDLSVKEIKSFALRAGFIHDPQPYLLSKSAVRNFVCAGFGLGIGRFQFDAAAKINLFEPDVGRFHANVFSLGLSYDL